MALTRSFKETVEARVASDPAFKEALLIEGLSALHDGDLDTGEAILRDYIKAMAARVTTSPLTHILELQPPGDVSLQGDPSRGRD